MSKQIEQIKRLFRLYTNTTNNQPYYAELISLFLSNPKLLSDPTLTRERIILGLEYE